MGVLFRYLSYKFDVAMGVLLRTIVKQQNIQKFNHFITKQENHAVNINYLV